MTLFGTGSSFTNGRGLPGAATAPSAWALLRLWAALAVLCLGYSPLSLAQTRFQPPLPPDIQSEEAGHALAKQLRESMPEENSSFKAVLKTRSSDGQIRRVLLSCQVCVSPDSWQTIYVIHPTNELAAATFGVRHQPGHPNQYWFTPGSAIPTSSVPSEAITAESAAQPLAGSDFWLMDLSMDFLHWPVQRLIRTEMRKGRWCHLLESRDPHPAPHAYARVLCWLDKEKNQPLLAEAYDQENNLLKEFSIGSMQKVNGLWQVKDMKISNVQTRSRTWLEFNLDSE